MKDLYIKVANEGDLINALTFARVMDENKQEIWLTSSHDYALDIIGTIYNDDAVFADDGVTLVTPATPKDGFHANLRLLNDSLESKIPPEIIIPKPNNPVRRFA